MLCSNIHKNVQKVRRHACGSIDVNENRAAILRVDEARAMPRRPAEPTPEHNLLLPDEDFEVSERERGEKLAPKAV